MTRDEYKKELHDILNELRLRVEREDDDFHYQAVLEAQWKLNSLTDAYFGEPKC